MIKPKGLTFKFLVNPNLSEKDKKAIRAGILKKSGLDEYYEEIEELLK